MAQIPLNGVKVCLFDAYGTLFDFASAVRGCKSAIAFQSSNSWDAYAAAAFGMQVVWCNRYGQRRERLPGTPDREVTSLTELPALVDAPASGLATSYWRDTSAR